MSKLKENTKTVLKLLIINCVAAFLYCRQPTFFKNRHYRRILFDHVAILMSSMQCIVGYMVTLKVFDY